MDPSNKRVELCSSKLNTNVEIELPIHRSGIVTLLG